MVGKTASKIRFNHSIKLRRAINAETLERLIGKVNFVIIEEINSNEEEHVKQIINQFRQANTQVYFFPDTRDEVTMGVADELEYGIYSSLNTLCSVIESEQGIKVKAGFGLNLVENDVDSSNDFGQTLEMSEVIEELDRADLANQQNQQTQYDTGLEQQSTDRFTGFDESLFEPEDTSNTDSIPEMTPEELSAELEYLPENVSNEINRLKMQLSDLNYDYSLAVEDMRVATERIANLEKIITTLKDEKECMQAEFNSILETNDVLEDPISLSTYQVTVDELNDRNKQVENLEIQVSELKKTVEDDKVTISSKMAEITDLSDKLTQIENELNSINDSIASGEIHKEVVAEFTEKIESIKSDRDTVVREANELKIKASTDASTIGLLNKNLALETQYRYASVEMFMELIEKLNSKINELNYALAEKSNIESQLESSEDNSGKLANDLAMAMAKINELSKLEGTLSAVKAELETKKSELSDLKDELANSQASLMDYSNRLSEKDEELSNASAQIAELNNTIRENEENSRLELEATIQVKDRENKEALDSANEQMEALKETLQRTIDADNERLESELKKKEQEYTNEFNKYVEDAARVVDEMQAENNERVAKLTAQLDDSVKQCEAKDETIKDQSSKIASLEQTVENNNLSIDDLNSTVESLNSIIETKDAQLDSVNSQLTEKDSIIDNLNNTVADRDKTIKSKEYAILKKDRELAESAEDIQTLTASIEALEAKHTNEIAKHTSKIEELNKQIEELNSTITSRDYTIGVQSVGLEERDKDIEQLKEDIELARKNREILEAKVKRADERFKSTLERLKISGGDIEKLMAESPSGLSQEDIDELNNKLSMAQDELEKANVELDELKHKYNDAVKQLSDATKELTAKAEEVTSASVTIQQLKSRVEQLENEVQTLESIKDGASSDEFEAIKNQNSTLVEKNSALVEQLNTSLDNEIANKRLVARLESELETYKNLVAELKSSTSNAGSQCTIGSIKYNRNAQIISVLGNRSCGITTLAVSIARRLAINTSVLYIDFDMIAPNGDVIFKKAPIVDIRGGKNTSLGAMSAFSSNLTASEIKGLAIEAEKTKGGRLDYFSGYHYKPADSIIANTDFQRMFDVLGEHYDYIIIDLGKIGASTFNNSIIQEIAKISYRTIGISNHDFFNVRAMIRTLGSMSINHKSIAWVINKVPENQVGTQNLLSLVHPKIIESLANCRVGAFADDLKLRGLPLDFSAGSRSNKLNFDMFLTQTVFG